MLHRNSATANREDSTMGTPATNKKSGAPGTWDIRRLHVRFTGQVQGVGFRWTARKVAQGLGLTGWVRNEPDGSVTMELQGTSGHLGQWFTLFDRQYANYPLRYIIDEKDDIEPVEGESAFRVRF